MKRRILSEKNLAVVLFVMVLVIFSLAQEDTKKIEKMYLDTNASATSQNESKSPAAKTKIAEDRNGIQVTRLR
jgi:hypothetical protein